jgi:uncharacterized membrane protein YqjE
MKTSEESIAAALRAAVQDARELVRSEVALARAELRDEVRRVRAGATALVIAAVAALMALVFLLTTIAWAISEGLGWPAWTGFGIVTLAVGILAVALAYVGRKRLAGEPHMPLTVETLKENVQWMRARTS